MAAVQSLNFCLYCQKSQKLIKQLIKHDFHIDVLSYRQFNFAEIAFINKTKYISKLSHDTTAILFPVYYQIRLDHLLSTAFDKMNI